MSLINSYNYQDMNTYTSLWQKNNTLSYSPNRNKLLSTLTLIDSNYFPFLESESSNVPETNINNVLQEVLGEDGFNHYIENTEQQQQFNAWIEENAQADYDFQSESSVENISSDEMEYVLRNVLTDEMSENDLDELINQLSEENADNTDTNELNPEYKELLALKVARALNINPDEIDKITDIQGFEHLSLGQIASRLSIRSKDINYEFKTELNIPILELQAHDVKEIKAQIHNMKRLNTRILTRYDNILDFLKAALPKGNLLDTINKMAGFKTDIKQLKKSSKNIKDLITQSKEKPETKNDNIIKIINESFNIIGTLALGAKRNTSDDNKTALNIENSLIAAKNAMQALITNGLSGDKANNIKIIMKTITDILAPFNSAQNNTVLSQITEFSKEITNKDIHSDEKDEINNLGGFIGRIVADSQDKDLDIQDLVQSIPTMIQSLLKIMKITIPNIVFDITKEIFTEISNNARIKERNKYKPKIK